MSELAAILTGYMVVGGVLGVAMWEIIKYGRNLGRHLVVMAGPRSRQLELRYMKPQGDRLICKDGRGRPVEVALSPDLAHDVGEVEPGAPLGMKRLSHMAGHRVGWIVDSERGHAVALSPDGGTDRMSGQVLAEVAKGERVRQISAQMGVDWGTVKVVAILALFLLFSLVGMVAYMLLSWSGAIAAGRV